MRSFTSRDDPGRRRALAWAVAGVATVTLLATALWLCVAVLPRKLYPSLSASDLTGLNPAEQAERREGRDRLQNDTRTTLLQGLAALLVLTGAGIGAAVTLRQVRISRDQLQQAREQAQLSDARAREQLELAREQALRSDERPTSRLPSLRKVRSQSDLPAQSTSSVSPALTGSTSASVGCTPWSASRTTPIPTGWLWSRSSVHSSAPLPMATPLARPIPCRCTYRPSPIPGDPRARRPDGPHYHRPPPHPGG